MSTPTAPSPRSTLSLALLWIGFELRETLREPLALLLNVCYPILMIAFLVLPNESIRSSEQASLMVITIFALMGATLVCINFPGISIPPLRESAYYRFTRTLPMGAIPRLAAWTVTPMVNAILSIALALAFGVLTTAMRPSLTEVFLVLAVTFLMSIPLILVGLTLGLILPKRGSMAATLIVAFAFIIAGGFFSMGGETVAWLDTLGSLLPTGAARHIVEAVFADRGWPAGSLLVLAAWTTGALITAAIAYRRDEGRSFA